MLSGAFDLDDSPPQLPVPGPKVRTVPLTNRTTVEFGSGPGSTLCVASKETQKGLPGGLAPPVRLQVKSFPRMNEAKREVVFRPFRHPGWNSIDELTLLSDFDSFSPGQKQLIPTRVTETLLESTGRRRRLRCF
ncbi:Hypothetical protein SMAX5B_003067 [Scophthalmus maximus]|uniref:Uncharacterized protein n=1 Tax=Scophthalmus maximus TaxID=52904 RepID=A0A2U9BM55_SCOMX|nr:Hypothetical protein SMAX5B_003067 [Scophthalmus maximus]